MKFISKEDLHHSQHIQLWQMGTIKSFNKGMKVNPIRSCAKASETCGCPLSKADQQANCQQPVDLTLQLAQEVSFGLPGPHRYLQTG